MPVDLGVYVVGPLLPEFARQFPGITFDLDLSSRKTDLVGDHVDIAIRLGDVKGDQLVARRLGGVERALFASPAYLDLRGEPGAPAELAEHDCLQLQPARRSASWRLERDGEAVDVAVRGRIAVNNHGLTRLLAERGLGIAALTPDLVRDALASGRLVRVLPHWTMPALPIHAVTASRLQPASAKAFIEFLRTRLGG